MNAWHIVSVDVSATVKWIIDTAGNPELFSGLQYLSVRGSRTWNRYFEGMETYLGIVGMAGGCRSLSIYGRTNQNIYLGIWIPWIYGFS